MLKMLASNLTDLKYETAISRVL